MSRRVRLLFLLVVLTQAAHSCEEYVGRLWEVWLPAQFLSSLVSPSNPVFGFLIINGSLVALGFWCYLWLVRRNAGSGRAWVWFWVLLESVNGVGHTIWAVADGQYRPGLLTAIPFLVLVPLLVRELLQPRPSTAPA